MPQGLGIDERQNIGWRARLLGPSESTQGSIRPIGVGRGFVVRVRASGSQGCRACAASTY
jgi:hypothetical protein